jgi:predicted TIM-barrel enzyme
VLVGSGVSAENIGQYPDADAFIVGSSLKQGGAWWGALDPARVQALARAFSALPRG